MSVSDLDLSLTMKEMSRVYEIAQRAHAKYGNLVDRRVSDWALDITVVHCNDTPLDLDRLLSSDDFNFGHDVLGIMKNLDRDNGKLMNFFLPRFAQPAEAENEKS